MYYLFVHTVYYLTGDREFLMMMLMQENNRTELERLDRERQADFLHMLKGFVVSQV